MQKQRPLVFIRLPTECWVPSSHKLNPDGYFRYRLGGSLKMFHRFVWENRHGPIPVGFEINHLCNNRACSNIEHLECIPRQEHLVKTNASRYLDRKLAAKAYWAATRCTGTHLGQQFGVSFSAACEWVREWSN